MPARALIVLLIILNLGVALWWMARGDTPAPRPEVVLPEGAEPLRLLHRAGELPQAAASPAPLSRTAPQTQGAAGAPAPGTLAPVAAAAEPAPVAAEPAPVCRSLGPFEDAGAAAQAEARVRPLVRSLARREVASAPRGWQVRMRALPDREAAAAMVPRLVAAGFRDHYLMPTAEDGTVDIALGRFGSEPAARRHEQALAAAGFEAVAEPLGGAGLARYWLDAVLAPDADPAEVQRASGATRSEPVECTAPAAR